jgi:DNA-binding NtrC family response regulator
MENEDMSRLAAKTRRMTKETKPMEGVALRVPDMPHILIVHDHDADTERLKGVFRKAGLTSESVNNITQGCESAQSGRFQVVFSSPVLGDGSWKRLIEVAIQNHLPFEVILLARTFDRQWAEALQLGAFDVLDVLWDLPKAGETAKRASAMTHLKRSRPHPDAVQLT